MNYLTMTNKMNRPKINKLISYIHWMMSYNYWMMYIYFFFISVILYCNIREQQNMYRLSWPFMVFNFLDYYWPNAALFRIALARWWFVMSLLLVVTHLIAPIKSLSKLVSAKVFWIHTGTILSESKPNWLYSSKFPVFTRFWNKF